MAAGWYRVLVSHRVCDGIKGNLGNGFYLRFSTRITFTLFSTLYSPAYDSPGSPIGARVTPTSPGMTEDRRTAWRLKQVELNEFSVTLDAQFNGFGVVSDRKKFLAIQRFSFEANLGLANRSGLKRNSAANPQSIMFSSAPECMSALRFMETRRCNTSTGVRTRGA